MANLINQGGNDTQVNNPDANLQPGDPGYAGGTGSAANMPPPATGAAPPPLPNPYDPSRSTQPGPQAQQPLAGQPTPQSPYPTDFTGWANYSGNPSDPNAINAFVQWLASQQGEDPSVASQEDYLASRIAQTGGLTEGNEGYWENRTKAGNWTAPEGPGASATSFPGLTSQQLLDEMNKIFTTGAANSPTASQANPNLLNYLNKILQDPSSLLDTGLINKEVMNARDQEEQNRNVNTQSLEAQLASRGIAGSGAEGTGLENLTAQLANIFGQNVTQINTNAAAQAEDQLKNAVTSATGLSEADAQNLIQQYEATTQRAGTVAGAQTNTESALANFLLGEGNLATQNNAQSIGAQEFADTFGLQQEEQAFQQGQITSDQLLQWLKDHFSGVQTSAGGFVG